MLNKVIRLVKPKRFEVFSTSEELNEDIVIMRPTFMSICHADQRYYHGSRPKHVLESKLPMSLIHEAIGEVVYDPKGQLKNGDRMAMIPNLPGYLFGLSKSSSCLDETIGENYCRDGRFRSSNFDGFTQELIFQPREMLVRLPTGLSNEVASFTELLSVSIHAIKRFRFFSNGNKESFGIWGDGNVGYITALILRKMFPESQIAIFGKHVDKLSLFTFADKIIPVHELDHSIEIDHAFECVGGKGSEDAIHQIIDLIRPGGTVNLLGVSEHHPLVNTRMILEKGLILLGHSRSGKEDFEDTVRFLVEENIEDYLRLLISNIVTVKSTEQLMVAFEHDNNKVFGKTVIQWEF